ncbi:hypothetical protein [Paenibacillus sp. A3]|nr:hypothetical protein [Paenibacillus sp. A3]
MRKRRAKAGFQDAGCGELSGVLRLLQIKSDPASHPFLFDRFDKEFNGL